MPSYKMLFTQLGAPGNGLVSHEYVAGEVYGPDTHPPLFGVVAEAFVAHAWAVEIPDPVEEAPAPAAPTPEPPAPAVAEPPVVNEAEHVEPVVSEAAPQSTEPSVDNAAG